MTITANKYRADDPSLVLDYAGTPVGLRCGAQDFTHVIDTTFDDVSTFCEPGAEAPGLERHRLTAQVFISHGPGGTYELLNALNTGQPVTWALLLDRSTAISTTNKEFSGTLYVPSLPMLAAGPRGFSLVTVEFRLTGAPIENTVTPVFADHATT